MIDDLRPSDVVVVRPGPVPASLIPKQNLNYHNTAGGSRVRELVRTIAVSLAQGWRSRPDLVMSFNALPYGVVAALLGLVLRRPYHVGFVGSDVEQLRRRPWLARLLRGAAIYTVPGTQSMQLLRSLGFHSPIWPMPHSIDLGHFRVTDNVSRTIDCVFVGSLVPVKRVDRLIKAVAIGVATGEPWNLTVVGDGPERSNLESLVNTLGVSTSVTFLGYINDPSPILRASRMIVMPSAHEGLPFALIEGMASGVVPIATRVGDIPSLIRENRNGVLLESSDPEEICEVVETIRSNPELEVHLRINAIEDSALYSFDNAMAIWHEIFDTLKLTTGPEAPDARCQRHSRNGRTK